MWRTRWLLCDLFLQIYQACKQHNELHPDQVKCKRAQSRKANDFNEPQHYGMQIDAELVGVAERTNPFDAVAQPPSLPSASSDGVVVGRSIVMHVEKI